MAAGDIINGHSSISNNSYLTLQPDSGVEWCIHNILYAGAVELEYYDGTNTIKFDADSAFGARLNLCLHCTNSKYYRVKNVSGGSIYIGYDGVQTK